MSETDAQAPADDGGALSTDQAVALLRRGAQPQEASKEGEAPAEAVDATDEEAGEGEENESAGQSADEGEDAADDEPPSEDAEEGEEAEAEPEEAEPIEPPTYWTPEHKAEFAKLTRRGQELVLTYEQQRAGVTRTALEQATNARKQADVATQAHLEQAERLKALLPQAEKLFTARWAGVDLVEIAEAEGPEVAKLVREQQKTEEAALEELRTATAKAEEDWFSNFQQTEAPKLLRAIPELSDPAKAPKVLSRIKVLLDTAGYSPEEVRLASARDLSIAHKAALYDELMASGLARPNPTPKPKPAPKPTPKPTAGQAAPPPKQREVVVLDRRLSQSGRIDDAAALLSARRKAG